MDRSLTPEMCCSWPKAVSCRSWPVRESCVIVGRCADFVLRRPPGRTGLLLFGSESARLRCIEEYGIAPEAADAEIRR